LLKEIAEKQLYFLRGFRCSKRSEGIETQDALRVSNRAEGNSQPRWFEDRPKSEMNLFAIHEA